jgi:hypothetical protein
LQGFQGFTAQLGDARVEFKAFVFEPGEYQGDSVHILWMHVEQADGSKYYARAGVYDSTGELNLHVVQVEPRFRGSLEAWLTSEDDPTSDFLPLSLSFDIDPRAGCP